VNRGPGRIVFLALILAFFAVFLLWPILYVFREAFFPGGGGFSLAYFGQMFADRTLRESLLTSLLLGAVVTALSTLIALPLAICSVRYRFRGKGWLMGVVLLPMIMPPFVGAIGVRHVLAQQGPLTLLCNKLGLVSGSVDWLGMGGFWAVAALAGLHLYPIMYLNLVATLANIDPELEEAARSFGASGWGVFRRVTLPLLLPGYFAGASIVFIWAFTDLGTPLIFKYRQLVAYRIYTYTDSINVNPMGHALVVLVIVMAGALFVASRYLVGAGRGASLTRATRARREISPNLPGACGIYLLLAAVTFLAIIPHLSVIAGALGESWSMTILPEHLGLGHFREAAAHRYARFGLANSLLYSCGSTALDVVLGAGLAYFLSRGRPRWGWLLDALAMMPLAIPGVVIAFGYLGAFGIGPASWVAPFLVMSYTVRRLPYMVRACYAGLEQTSVSLEEASASLGASGWTTIRRITLPLVAANVVGGAILAFSFAMLEVSDSLILAQKVADYPLTKAIYSVFSDPVKGEYIASAMGVLGMAILFVSLLAAGKVLGRRMGLLFRV